VMKRSRFYRRPTLASGPASAMGQAGGVLLTETIRAAGLDVALSDGLGRWRRPAAVHDPGKVILDLAVALALGGDCLADVAVLRAEPGVFGSVASDPTVSRTITALAADAPAALAAINIARAAARARVWELAGGHAPDHDTTAAAPLVIDLDATLGHRALGEGGRGPDVQARLWVSPVVRLRRPRRRGHRGDGRRAASPGQRPGRKVLIRTDGAGSSHAFLDWLTGQRLSYSVGFALPNNPGDLLAMTEEQVWTPAYNSDGQVREGAWVAELTSMLTLTGRPKGMRVIARKERPHPGAQLRITDADGLRVTAFATNTTRGQLPDLELRHRRRARAEDRIRCAKDTGQRNLPLHSFAQNQLWCAIVTLAAEITAWLQLLALTSTNARRWEPKRLRLRLFTIAAALTRHSRKTVLTLNQKHPWATLAHDGITALRLATAPG
jgi:hypothetical protein